MQVTLLINVLNVFGNYALIFGHFGFPALGVQGAAISTSVCRGVAMTLLFIMLFKRLVPRIPLAYFRPLHRQFGGREKEASRLFIELVCLEEVVADYAGR